MKQATPDGVTGQRSPRWAFMSRMEIPSKKNDGEIYLSRLRIVQTPWFAVLLHDINEPDWDRDPHDHPWNFWSFIVRGTYTELIWDHPEEFGSNSYKRRWNRFSLHKMTTEKAHQIVSLNHNTRTLLFCGRRSRNWGFWTPEGWVRWQKYCGLEE